MTSTPARQAIGIYCASGMRNSRISSNTTACTMPATGVFPPLLIFAMVRAMAPVAGIPPNSGVAMLATPCAISSVLESCLSPITPSATVADSKDSMAPSTAIVMATGNKFFIASQSRAGITASGSSARMLKRSPMVSIQSMPPYTFISQTATVTTMMAISDPGIFFENRGVMAMMKILTILTIVFHQLTVSKCRK